MHDGSITFSTALDNSKLWKDLNELTKKIEGKEKELASTQKEAAAAVKEQEKAYRSLQKAQEDLQKAQDKRDSLLNDQQPLIDQLDNIRLRLNDAREAAEKYKKQWLSGVAGADRNWSASQDLSRRLQSEYDEVLGRILKMDPAIDRANEKLSAQESCVITLTEKYDAATQTVEKYEQNIEQATQALERQKEEAGELRQQIDAVELPASSPGDSQSHLDSYLKKSSSIYQQISGMVGKTSEMSSVMQDMAGATSGELSAGLQSAGTALGGFSAELSGALAAAGPYIAIALAVVAVVEKIVQAIKKAAEVAANFFRSFLEGLSKGAQVLKKFGKVAVKAFSQVAAGVAELLDGLNVLPKMFSSIGKSWTKLGQMIRRVFVFSIITSGLRAIRTQMTAYLTVNAEFSNALRQLKGVLLTAFQPIYDVVVPALTMLMNVLSRVIAAISQFTAVLFGTTAKKAQENAKALYEQAQAASAAGSAAEDAAGSLAAFDEINTISTESSSGGGGGSADTGPLFDWEYEDTPFPDWGEAFSAFLDKMLAGIPKLEDAFKGFADWLNDLSKKLYDMFTFPGVLEKVERLGRDLANAFNKLVGWIDWYQLGQALGAGLNLALQFLTEFIYTFSWVDLGRRLAECVNGLVSEVDWYDFGRLLWSGFKIGLEMLAGFLLGLNMPELAQAASNVVKGFFNSMLETIRKIDWGQIGRQIAEFLVKLDWYGMLSSVTSAIAAGLMAAVAAVRGFLNRIVPELDSIAREIVTALIEFFRDKVDWAEMARTIGDGIAAALHFVASLLDPELFYEVGRAIGDFFINLQWVEIFGGLTEALANGINAAVAALSGFLDSIGPHLKEIADGMARKINEFVQNVDWAELGQTISRGIEAALDFMIELMNQIDWDAVGTAICEFLENIDWDTLLGKWGTLMGEFINAKLKAVDLSSAISLGFDIIAGIIQGMINKFNAEGGVLGWIRKLIYTPFINGFRALFQIGSPSKVMEGEGGYLIEGLWNGISDAWHTITDFFGEKLGALKQTLSDAWENIKTTASQKWETIKTALGNIWDKVKETAKDKFELVREKVGEAWENIKGDAPGKWEEVKTVLGTAWENVRTSAQEKFGEVKQNIIDKMGELKKHDWKAIGSTIMNGIWDGLKNIWSSITSWASQAASWLGDIFSGAKSAISGVVSNITGSSRSSVSVASYAMPQISPVQVPALAQGAVIPPNREFMAVLGDQGNGNNLEAPESLIRKIVREESGGGNTELLQAILEAIKAGHVIMVDRRVLGQTVTNEQNRMTRQSGRSVVLG